MAKLVLRLFGVSIISLEMVWGEQTSFGFTYLRMYNAITFAGDR